MIAPPMLNASDPMMIVTMCTSLQRAVLQHRSNLDVGDT